MTKHFSAASVRLSIAFIALFATTTLSAASQNSAGRQGIAAARIQERPWTVEDSLRVRYFVDGRERSVFWSRERSPVVHSPDGRFFFAVSRSGDLACDCNVYELVVYATEQVNRAFRSDSGIPILPIAVVRMNSKLSTMLDPGISNVRWVGSGRLRFRGMDESGQQFQFFELDVASNRLTPLTGPARSADAVEYNARSVIYTSINWLERSDGPNGYPVNPVSLPSDVLWTMGIRETWTFNVLSRFEGGPEREVDTSAPGSILRGPWLSPDGERAIVLYAPRQRSPAHEIGYDVSPRYQGLPLVDARFMLVDLRTGTVREAVDAPWGLATMAGVRRFGPLANATTALEPVALWSADSSRVVLVNTALPIDDNNPEHARQSYIVDLDVRSGQRSIIAPMQASEGRSSHVRAVAWRTPGESFVVELATDDESNSESILYALADGRWQANPNSQDIVSREATRTSEFEVSLRQSANDPPALVAIRGGREIILTPPDPALTGVRRAHVETIEWIEADGQKSRGLLMMPRRDDDLAPVPLVIQSYDARSDLFWPDGHASTAVAAQPLVAAGIAVLQIDIPAVDRPSYLGTPQEGVSFVNRIDQVVEMLAHRGLVDPACVGLIGFSRGGFMTYYALTHPGRTNIRSAVVADGFQASWIDYLEAAARNDLASVEQLERQFGGGSFWDNRAGWLEHSPGFNAIRLRTPLLYQATGAGRPFGGARSYEVIGAFRLANAPLDYLFFPTGHHQLQRPRERRASLQASVDWMRFWLQGIEDSDPEKVEQYRRWRQLRDRHQAPPGNVGQYGARPDRDPQR